MLLSIEIIRMLSKYSLSVQTYSISFILILIILFDSFHCCNDRILVSIKQQYFRWKKYNIFESLFSMNRLENVLHELIMFRLYVLNKRDSSMIVFSQWFTFCILTLRYVQRFNEILEFTTRWFLIRFYEVVYLYYEVCSNSTGILFNLVTRFIVRSSNRYIKINYGQDIILLIRQFIAV